MSNNERRCGCSTIFIFIIMIVLITMCNRLTEKPIKSQKEYSIIYPNGDTIKIN